MPPGLAYRVFKDGTPFLIRDTAAFKSRLARAVLESLDLRPVEELFTRGVLGASESVLPGGRAASNRGEDYGIA